MARVGFGKKMVALSVVSALVGLGAAVPSASATTIQFAQFADTPTFQWSYSNSTGVLGASNVAAIFQDFGAGIITYNGAITYSITATASSAVTGAGTGASPYEQQVAGGLLKVWDASSNLMMEMTFSGTFFYGAGSNGNLNGDSTLVGQTIAFDPIGDGPYSHTPGSYIPPFSFNIVLLVNNPLSVTGSNFTSFTASNGGAIFSANQLGGGSTPTPLPAAATGGLSLLGALGIGAFARRHRRR